MLLENKKNFYSDLPSSPHTYGLPKGGKLTVFPEKLDQLLLDFHPVKGNSLQEKKKSISSQQLKSSNGLKPVHKTSISSIQCGSEARPFDGIVIFLQRVRRVRFP